MTALALGAFALILLLVFMLGEGYVCQHCGTAWGARRVHMHTAYNDEESNYRTLCPPCEAEENAYWDERWEEVYQDQRASAALADWWARHG